MQGVERAPQLAPLLKDLSNRCHSQTKTIERGQDSGGETEMFFEGEKKNVSGLRIIGLSFGIR